jgi:hypothetical protein
MTRKNNDEDPLVVVDVVVFVVDARTTWETLLIRAI